MSAVKKIFVVEQLRRAQMNEVLGRGMRIDGRGFSDMRELTITTNVIEKAEGSARVKLGNTELIAGVKVNLGTPFPDTPDKGLLIVSAEVLPLASPYAEPGPPDESTIELARVADRGIRESGMIDVSKLVLVEGKHVYAVFVDVSILNVDGNLFDATSYAVVSSLMTAKIPKYVLDEKGLPSKTDETVPLPIQTVPVSITMARIGDHLRERLHLRTERDHLGLIPGMQLPKNSAGFLLGPRETISRAHAERMIHRDHGHLLAIGRRRRAADERTGK